MLMSVKTQIRVMFRKREYKFTMLILFVYACYVFVNMGRKYWGAEVSTMMDANQYLCNSIMEGNYSFIYIFFPFLIVLPYATSYVDDYKNQLLSVYVTRSSRTNYYVSKLISCFLGTTLVVAIPFFCNFVLTNLFFPHNHFTLAGSFQSDFFCDNLTGENIIYFTDYLGLPFRELFLKSQFLYYLLYIILLSLFSGLMGTFALSLSFLWRKSKLLLFLPVYLITQLSVNLNGLYFNKAIEFGDKYFVWEIKKHVFPDPSIKILEYFDINILNYVFPYKSFSLNPYFFIVFCLVITAIIVGMAVYGIRKEIQSLQ